MIYAINKFIQTFIFIPFILLSTCVCAQSYLIQNSIFKLQSYNNFSYQSVNEIKELFVTDTLKEKQKAIFVKAPEDNNSGYLFNIQTLNEYDKLTYTDLYNGKDLIRKVPEDSTYILNNIRSFNMQTTLPGCLKWIQSRLGRKTSKVVKANDTTINGVDSYHLIINVYDTIINNEHNYTYVHFCIDKILSMPDCIIVKSRNTTYGNGASYYYSNSNYSDYKFNEPNIDIASMTILKGFHQPKAKPTSALLTSGTIAPDWVLYDATGKKTSLKQLKGKIILLDFFFIGCGPCMLSLKPLDKLYEKYKNQNVVMLSISNSDSNKKVLAFKKNYNVKYSMYGNESAVAELYNVTGAPTFYFIDKEGKIANVIVGYSKDFEGKAISIFDSLLKK